MSPKKKPEGQVGYASDNSSDKEKCCAVSATVINTQGGVGIENKHVAYTCSGYWKQQQAMEDYLQSYQRKWLQGR